MQTACAEIILDIVEYYKTHRAVFRGRTKVSDEAPVWPALPTQDDLLNRGLAELARHDREYAPPVLGPDARHVPSLVDLCLRVFAVEPSIAEHAEYMSFSVKVALLNVMVAGGGVANTALVRAMAGDLLIRDLLATYVLQVGTAPGEK